MKRLWLLAWAIATPTLASAEGILFPSLHHEPTKADTMVFGETWIMCGAAKIDVPFARARADFVLDSSVEESKRIYVYRSTRTGNLGFADLAPVAILSSDDFPTTATLKETDFAKGEKEQTLYLFTGDRESVREMGTTLYFPDHPLSGGNVLLLAPSIEPIYEF